MYAWFAWHGVRPPSRIENLSDPMRPINFVEIAIREQVAISFASSFDGSRNGVFIADRSGFRAYGIAFL